MERWHNGPNGPGVCKAKKGKCPFGGEESHFQTKSTAEAAFKKECEKEHGILPEINIGNKITKIKIYDIRGNTYSLSNFVISSGKGSAADASYFSDKVEEGNMDAKEIVKLLNKDKNILNSWTVKKENESDITLKSKDTMGNTHYVDIKKEKAKEKGHDTYPGKTISYNSHNIPTSLGNYVSVGSGGSAEAKAYIKDIIDNSGYDSKKLIDSFNKNKRIFGQWSLVEEDDIDFKIKNEDSMGNIHFITISKK